MKSLGIYVRVTTLGISFACYAFSAPDWLSIPANCGDKSSNQTTRSTTAYSREPLDPAVGKLLPHYQGNAPESIYRLLQERTSARNKGEFESTEEYEKRLVREDAKPLLGGLRTTSIYAFLLEESVLETNYDADDERMHVFIFPGVEPSSGDTEGAGKRWTLLTNQKIESLGTYVASNAFGAKVQVRSSRDSEFLIAFSDLAGFNLVERASDSRFGNLTRSGIRLDFPLAKARARTLKGRMGVLAVCRLMQPYVAEHFEHFKATFDDPNELRTNEFYIGTQLLQVWAYERGTGEILFKVGRQIQEPD